MITAEEAKQIAYKYNEDNSPCKLFLLKLKN